MKIDQVDPGLLKSWAGCFKLQGDLWRILDHLRHSEEFKPLVKNRITLEPADPTDKPMLFLGLYAKRAPLSWLGFQFVDINESPKFEMRVEGFFPGNITSEKLKGRLPKTLAESFEKRGADREFLSESTETWLHFRQSIDAEYNGDADKMYEWLLSAAKEFSELQPRKR